MEKKIYSRPSVSETKLDSEIILMQISGEGGVSTSNTGNVGMGLDETNETNGDIVSQFMNPLKWFR